METTFIDVLNQLKIVIPTMMAAELLLTSTIKGIFNITSDLANTILSWVISLATAFLFVLCNGLDFGLGGWNYAVAAVGGLIVAICANKIYTWDKIKALLDAITDLFSGGKQYIARMQTEEKQLNERMEKLSTFLQSDKIESLTTIKKLQLERQLEAMSTYRNILKERLYAEMHPQGGACQK